MNKEEFKEIIVEQNTQFQKQQQSILREKFSKIVENKHLPHIVIITGLRRVGKSVLLSQINKKLYPQIQYRYLNFEDEKLLKFTTEQFSKLYETFLEFENTYEVFFFDEIQNIENWEIAIRKLYEKNIKFYITGSNASMLSKELGTKLTGRHISYTLYPFSFREFIRFNSVEINKNDIYISEKKAKLKQLFDKYLEMGGIPEYLYYQKKEIIQHLYEDIVYKDILVRYNLSDEKILKELIQYLLSNISKEFSYNRIKNLFGFGSSNTVKNYISYLENSYLIFQLEKFDFSYKKSIQAPKKIYTIDPAFINNVSFKFSQDKGRLLENLVFIELKRQEKELYYHREKKECDFLIKEGLEITQAIQVTQSIEDEQTKQREIAGLIDACNTHNLKQGLLLTIDEEDEIIKDNIKIIVQPVWKWLLANYQ